LSAAIILSLANQATDNIKLQLRAGDKLDIRHCIKVKKIPGGSTKDCAYVDGLVFSKNRTHKKMANDVPHPKILLLGCALEFVPPNLLSWPCLTFNAADLNECNKN